MCLSLNVFWQVQQQCYEWQAILVLPKLWYSMLGWSSSIVIILLIFSWLFSLCLCSACACANAATLVFLSSISVKHLLVLAGKGRMKRTRRQDRGACRLDSGACRAAPWLPVQAVLPAGRMVTPTSRATSQGTLILRSAGTHTHSQCEALTHQHPQDWLALNDWGSHSLTNITARHSLTVAVTQWPTLLFAPPQLLYCFISSMVTLSLSSLTYHWLSSLHHFTPHSLVLSRPVSCSSVSRLCPVAQCPGSVL